MNRHFRGPSRVRSGRVRIDQKSQHQGDGFTQRGTGAVFERAVAHFTTHDRLELDPKMPIFFARNQGACHDRAGRGAERVPELLLYLLDDRGLAGARVRCIPAQIQGATPRLRRGMGGCEQDTSHQSGTHEFINSANAPY